MMNDKNRDDGTVVVASFADRATAERAVDRLRETGYDRDEIGLASRDESDRTVVVDEEANTSGPGAVGGAVTGAAAGGTLAWLGLAAIPAIGPFLAAGAIGTALIGAGAGAVTGGVLGGLLGLGIPRHRAEHHQQQLERGLSLVTVRTGEPLVVERLLGEAGALEVDRGDDDGLSSRADEAVEVDVDR
jgi:hypothetical protein